MVLPQVATWLSPRRKGLLGTDAVPNVSSEEFATQPPIVTQLSLTPHLESKTTIPQIDPAVEEKVSEPLVDSVSEEKSSEGPTTVLAIEKEHVEALLSIEPVGNEMEFVLASTTMSIVEEAPGALITIEPTVGDDRESLVDSTTESFVEERLLPADSSLVATGASDDASLAFSVDSGIQKHSLSTTIVRCLIDVRPSLQTKMCPLTTGFYNMDLQLRQLVIFSSCKS
jgi:hypothetical protein